MKILSIGNFKNQSNTALHRHWCLEKIGSEVHQLNIEYKVSFFYKLNNQLFRWGLPIHLPDDLKINLKVRKLVTQNIYDIIWVDKSLILSAATLKFIKAKQPNVKIISFSLDNMTLRHNQSQNYLKAFKLYDIHITNKSPYINTMYAMGAQKVIFTNNTYEASYHYPRTVCDEKRKRYSCDVGFIGFWEKERCESLLFLAQNGILVKVFGTGKWNDYKNAHENLIIDTNGLYSEEYCKAIGVFKISIGFLRKWNQDLQTSRNMEIPACGGFMLSERTSELLHLFNEDEEAAYFGDNQELLAKCKYYLKHEQKRKQITVNGMERCRISGYSNMETLKRLLKQIENA